MWHQVLLLHHDDVLMGALAIEFTIAKKGSKERSSSSSTTTTTCSVAIIIIIIVDRHTSVPFPFFQKVLHYIIRVRSIKSSLALVSSGCCGKNVSRPRRRRRPK